MPQAAPEKKYNSEDTYGLTTSSSSASSDGSNDDLIESIIDKKYNKNDINNVDKEKISYIDNNEDKTGKKKDIYSSDDKDSKMKPQPKPLPPPHITNMNLELNNMKPPIAMKKSVTTSLSTQYTISDISRTKLLVQGSLCTDIPKTSCPIPMPDGEYVLRIGGNTDIDANTAAWFFCGIRGGAKEELAFQISKGKCWPGIKVKASEYM